MKTINLDDERDRWQWACPVGHRQWTPTNHHWWCAQCANSWDVDPEFYELMNLRTGETVTRDECRLVTDAGAFQTAPRAGGRT